MAEVSLSPRMLKLIVMLTAALAAALVSLGATGSPAKGSPDPMSLSLNASARTINYGSSVALSGTIAQDNGGPLKFERVILEQKPAGTPADDFRRVANQPADGVLSDINGAFDLNGVKPSANTDYRARYVEGNKVGTSAAVRVDVRAMVNQQLTRNTVKLGRKVAVFGTVVPNRTGIVRISIRHDNTFIQRATLLADSSYLYRYKAPEKGRYVVTSSFSPVAGSSTLGNVSQSDSFVVR